MFSTLFYKIFSALAYVFTTFWLGIFIVPFLGFLVMKLVKNAEDDTLQKITEPIGLKKYVMAFQTLLFTIFLYLILTIGTIHLRDMFANNIQRNDFKELLKETSTNENFYIDGKRIKNPKKIIEDILKVESRLIRNGSTAYGRGGKKRFHITFGKHNIDLRQDKIKEQEYWVYFDNDYIGRMDSYYFMSKEEEKIYRKRQKQKDGMIYFSH